MSQWLRALLANLCLLLVISAFAQPAFNIQVVNNAIPGEIASPRLRVSGFTNVISAQFAVCWDPQVLRYESVSHLNLPNLQDSVHFGTNRVNEGILGFAWPSPNPATGTNLTDGTSIFRINFRVIGPLSSGSPLRLCNRPPVIIEVGQIQNGNIIAVPDSLIIQRSLPGFVAVGYTVSNEEPAPEIADVVIAPNPFADRANITFKIAEATDISWRITDLTGKILLKNQEKYLAGQYGMEIANWQLQGAGAYFLIIETPKGRLTRPLFLL
jgi:hypothetical protein